MAMMSPVVRHLSAPECVPKPWPETAQAHFPIDPYARVTYVDEWGKRHQKKRKAISGTVREANRLIRELLAEIEEQDEKTIEGAKLTFRQLAEYFKKHYAQPAEYDAAGIKKAGMRAYKDTQNKLAVLTEYFGTRKIAALRTAI